MYANPYAIYCTTICLQPNHKGHLFQIENKPLYPFPFCVLALPTNSNPFLESSATKQTSNSSIYEVMIIYCGIIRILISKESVLFDILIISKETLSTATPINNKMHCILGSLPKTPTTSITRGSHGNCFHSSMDQVLFFPSLGSQCLPTRTNYGNWVIVFARRFLATESPCSL